MLIYSQFNIQGEHMGTQEERHQRFRRLASQRTNNILKAINILGNCSNKSTYSYTDEEVNRIFSELEKKLRETKSLFRSNKNKNEFKL